MKTLDQMLDELLGKEGGYVNNPNDSGGETIWGITVAVAREFGYKGSMRDMSRDQAKAIYVAKYWEAPRFNLVASMSQAIAEELFDTGVNCGVATASEMLQRALNVFNNQGTIYADISTDGRIGQATLGALSKYLAKRGAEGQVVLLKALNCLQGERYINLAERRQKDESFVYGWIRTRVEI